MSDGDTSGFGGIVLQVPLEQSCEWKMHSEEILCKAETFWDFEGNGKHLPGYMVIKGEYGKYGK